jgi:hypothetical protein
MKPDLRSLLALVLVTLAATPIPAEPATLGSFTVVNSMKQYRKGHTASLLPNGKVLISGGVPLAAAVTSELYDPATQTWMNSGTLNTGRQFHTATVLLDGKIVVTGGQTANRLLNSTELYDPLAGAWTNAGVLNTARSYCYIAEKRVGPGGGRFPRYFKRGII